MIDPSIIEAKIEEARQRDNIVTGKLLVECARLPVMSWGSIQRDQNGFYGPFKFEDLQRGNKTESGLPINDVRPLPDNGSYAYQLFSAIMFAVDARAELKLLELIASPHFYASLMRSAGEQP